MNTVVCVKSTGSNFKSPVVQSSRITFLCHWKACFFLVITEETEYKLAYHMFNSITWGIADAL